MEDTIFSIDPMNFDNSKSLLSNPDRGLRMETYITLGEHLCAYPNTNENPYDAIAKLIAKYKTDSPTLCQFYVYLSNYNKKPLDTLAFIQLGKALEIFKANGVRLLLRFAYATESVPDTSYKWVKIHIAQIKKWFNENKNLVSDTLYCLQTGVIGYWGEGHSYKHLSYFDIKKVINSICDLAPNGIYTQLRFHRMFKKVDKQYIDKVGFHDDYIVGDLNHKWAIAPISNRKLFDSIMDRARYTINDGEMPWGYAHYNDNPNEKLCDNLSGTDILKQLSIYHLTSFSLEHSYREKGRSYSMQKWKNIMLSYDDVVDLGVNANPHLFKNSKSEDIKLSCYDIIRYHLGYQLLLSGCAIKDNRFIFKITNYGFAAPLNHNYLAVVISENGVNYEIEVTQYDNKLLQNNTTISYSVPLKDNQKVIGIKLDTFKNRGVNIRFANNIKYENGVNYLLKK